MRDNMCSVPSSHRFAKSLFILVSALAPVVPAVGQAPDIPAIERDIHLTDGGQFTRPHAPPLRTSADGRVGLNMKKYNGKLAFYLVAPEKLQQPFLESPAGAGILSSTTPFLVDLPPGVGTLQHTLCDPTPAFPVAEATNPKACDTGSSNDDCYDMTIVGSFRFKEENDGPTKTKLWSAPVTVRVNQPKTSAAAITSVTLGTVTIGSKAFETDDFFEPTISADGRLLVARIQQKAYSWKYPDTGTNVNRRRSTTSQYLDIVYSMAADEVACDIEQWTELYPISNAPFNSLTSTRYGFAMQPFRDPAGNEIPDGADFQASYPWLDRQARNLFFTTLGETLDTRFNRTCFQPGCEPWSKNTGPTRGHSVAGLWTHGKVVLLDTLLNNQEFSTPAPDATHAWLDLYQPGSGPLGSEDGKVRFGFGRDNITQPADIQQRPPGYILNSTFLDSSENRFNYHRTTEPITPRDVVWRVDNGKVSDEIPFDDYNDPSSFILANMMAYMAFETPPTDPDKRPRYTFHDGWDGNAFSESVRLQNAATSKLWQVPEFGEVFGSGRHEPGARGGVVGRGFWADGTGGIEFEIQTQTGQNPDSVPWSVGFFLDPRVADDSTPRTLIAFPDGSEMRLEGRRAVHYLNASNALVRSITLPRTLPEREWTHLALNVGPGGGEVTLLLDGMAIDRLRSFSGPGLFRMTVGNLNLGKRRGSLTPGVRGWLDELKVFAREPGPETLCNLAGGTLVGFEAGIGHSLEPVADRYPTWAHAEIHGRLEQQGRTSYDRYACWRNGSVDHGAHLANIPAGSSSIRQSLHFPEGPVFHDAPRPDSVLNPFCLSCHTDQGLGGLSTAALSLESQTATLDPRRQPRQPDRLVFGNVPANWVASFNSAIADRPAIPMQASHTGIAIDPWLLPGLADVPLEVTALTLVDAASDRDLRTVRAGDTIDLATLPTRDLNIRASTNWPTGSVVFDLDGVAGFRTETAKPFALFGQTGGDYAVGSLAVGSHSVTATPFATGGGTGTALSVTFNVIDSVTAVVADFEDDFQPGSPAPGWSYLWNAGGAMGQAAHYDALRWDGQSLYDSDGQAGLPDATDMGVGSFGAGQARPGDGVQQPQNASPAVDRFAIAAYTVALDGLYSITQSEIRALFGAPSNGRELVIYVDDTLIQTVQSPADPNIGVSFDTSLGLLSAGQTIYVGVGPSLNTKKDRCELDFSITRTQPPALGGS